MANDKDILVVGELSEGRLAPASLELLGCARKLATELKGTVAAFLLGDQTKPLAQEIIANGADQVYVVENPLLRDYHSQAYLIAVEKLVRELQPRLVLLGHTSQGQDLAPRLAFRLGVAAFLDCIEVALEPQSQELHFTRPVYGGNARATFASPDRPQIASLRAKAYSPLEKDPSRQGQVISQQLDLDPSQLQLRLVEKVKAEASGVRLEEAEVVVSGGRGIGGPEGFAQLQELAQSLKGAVGATRAACDNGWWPATSQVGLTGKIIAPNLYIAIALSGSSQHMAGCSGSKNIIAINRDPEANIFKEARFGVVGDYKQVLPAFIAKVKALQAS